MSKAKEFDPKNYRDNPTAIAQYLTEILEKNDLDILLDAINFRHASSECYASF
jgi:DNA-binding phage protein